MQLKVACLFKGVCYYRGFCCTWIYDEKNTWSPATQFLCRADVVDLLLARVADERGGKAKHELQHLNFRVRRFGCT